MGRAVGHAAITRLAVRAVALWFAVPALLVAVAAASPRHYVKVAPRVVSPGKRVRVYGSVAGGCPAGAQVTLYSRAFKGATHARFAGVAAVFAKARRAGGFATTVRLSDSIGPGSYEVGGRCGGGNFGFASLRVSARAHAHSRHPAITYLTGAGHGGSTVWLASADGTHARSLGEGERALLSPDGRLIAVARFTPAGTESAIYSASGAPVHHFPSGGLPLAWSSDSRYLALERGEALIVIDTVSESARVIARGLVSGASFAPTGDRLVYGLGALPLRRMNTKIDLYSSTATGGRIMQLTHDGHSLNPLWGRRGIVFDHERLRARSGANPAYQLFLLRRGDSTQITHMRIPPLGFGLVPKAISANGKRLLAEYESEDDSWAWTVTLTTHEAHELRIAGKTVTGWGISGDGRRVLVDAGPQRPLSDGTVAGMPFSGGQARVLVRHGGAPSWNR